jgi:hypothetical protein
VVVSHDAGECEPNIHARDIGPPLRMTPARLVTGLMVSRDDRLGHAFCFPSVAFYYRQEFIHIRGERPIQENAYKDRMKQDFRLSA